MGRRNSSTAGFIQHPDAWAYAKSQSGHVRKSRLASQVAVLTVFFLLTMATIASADTLNVNDVVTHGNTSVEQGASGTAEVYLTDPTGSPSDDVNGCNGTGGTPAFVALSSSSASLTIDDNNGASSGNVTIIGCGAENAASVAYHVAASATVGAVITISGTASGGKAGSTYTADSFTVTVLASTPVDSTGPQISYTLTGTHGENGWFTSNVDVDWTVTDPESAVTIDSGCVDQTLTTETVGITLSCSAHSAGGFASDSVTVKLDTTGPSAALAVTAGTLGDNDWYTSNVTVSTSGTDDISGPVTCTVDQFLTTESTGHTFNGSCTNDAGLTTNAAPLTVKLDKTPPTDLAFVGGGLVDGGSYYFGFVPSGPIGCTAEGAISGLASCSVAGYEATVGAHTVTATAKDNAGNEATRSLSYSVLAWTINGFYAPVDRPDTYNITKNGSTVPLKFEVFAGATELTDTSIVSLFTQKVGCAAGAGDAIEEYSTGATSLRYDTTAGQFIFNWKTPKAPGSCYRVTMQTADGSSIYANFNLK